MTSPLKPMWREGLFMMPQHLQLADDYHEDARQRRSAALAEHAWGLSELEVDEDELARGLFCTKRCVAVLPDGLLVDIGGAGAIPSAVVMASGALLSDGGTVEVFLCIPSQATRGTHAYAGRPDQRSARFVVESRSVDDAFGQADEADVPGMRPNAQLLLGSDDRRETISIKIAEVVLGADGVVRLAERFVPPLVKIRACPPLMKRVARVAASLATKQRSLLERYQGRSASLVEFGAADMATFWFLHTVSSWVGTLSHFASAGGAHPERLYVALATLAGQLGCFAPHAAAADTPTFDHGRPGDSLLPLLDRIMKLLGTVVAARYTTLALEERQPGLFVAALDDAELLGRTQLYLVASGDVPATILRDDVPRYVKLGPLDEIGRIVQAASVGVEVELDTSPPAALPVRAHFVYLRVQQQGRYWDDAVRSGHLAIYQPVQSERVALELLAIAS